MSSGEWPRDGITGCTVVEIEHRQEIPGLRTVFYRGRSLSPGANHGASFGAGFVETPEQAACSIRSLLVSYAHGFFTAAEFGCAAMVFPARPEAWATRTCSVPTFRIMLTATRDKAIARTIPLGEIDIEPAFESIYGRAPNYGADIITEPTISSWIDQWCQIVWNKQPKERSRG